MHFVNQILFFLAQAGTPQGTPDANGGGTPGADAGDSGGIFGSLLMFLPAMFMILIVYFLLMNRPQQKQQAKAKEMLESLKKNDRVLTAGGILGTVVNTQDSKFITLRVDESSNAKMQVLKSSIVRVVTDEDETDTKSN